MKKILVIVLTPVVLLAFLALSNQTVAQGHYQPNLQKFRSEQGALGVTSTAHVTVCSSGCDFKTVQAALADSLTYTGTLITLMDAVHTEQSIVVSKSVTLEGRGVNQQTILEANAARGAATNRVMTIQGGANVTIRNLTIRYGHASTGGGVSNQSVLTITNSTIADNDADTYSGGIENGPSATLYLSNVTVSGNTVAGAGANDGAGGLGQYGNSNATIAYSTIANNSAPNVTARGGIWLQSGSLNIRNSIVAGNGSANCTLELDTAFTASGENIDNGASCTGFSKPNADPKLDGLKYNTGPGPTHALLSGSPAIDAIAAPCDVTTDERGIYRPQGAGCDIGAFELASATASTIYLPLISRSASASPSALPNFSHIFVIVLENKERDQIINSASAPYINALRGTYAEAANDHGIRHPSLPNYLTLTSGHTFGVSTDCNDCYQNAVNIVDQLEAAGRSWKGYMESMPSPCFGGDGPADPGKLPLYAQKHDPFYYYDDVRTNPARCNKIVPFDQFATDLSSGTLPEFVWITPNQVNDMHGIGGTTLEESIKAGNDWLQIWVPQILASPAWQNNGVLFITFDEGNSNIGCCGFDPGGGNIMTLVLSPLANQGGFTSNVAYNHYSLLHTIEEAWGLSYLGHAGDSTIQSMTDFFQLSP